MKKWKKLVFYCLNISKNGIFNFGGSLVYEEESHALNVNPIDFR